MFIHREDTVTTPTTESTERFSLIIHHLSDLHFQQTSQSDQAALVKYAQYLLGQPREKRPSIVVITGDLTANGNRNELETVASNLKIAFPEWSGNLKQHIYVVPGPHDVCWTGAKPP